MHSLLINQAEVIANKFGSKSKLADALGHPNRSTVQGWIRSGYIRPTHYEQIVSAAKARGVELEATDFQIVDAKALEQMGEAA